MRHIDMQTWARREHFKKFLAFNHPHFGMTVNVDLTSFYPVVKERGYSITVAIVYVLARVANAIPEFRYRIHAGEVVEHEVVHPSFTLLADGDLFSFCTLNYVEDFSEFAAQAEEKIAYQKEHLTLEDEKEEDDLLFMTALPWVSFTSFTHPMPLHPADSVPRFAWGKFLKERKLLKMPLGVQAHHALMDGIHMGRYYTEVQHYLHHPSLFLGEA